MSIICSLILLFGARLISELSGQPLSYYSLIALSPTILIVGIMAVFRGYFQGMQSTKPTAFSQIAEQVFNVIFSILLAWMFHARGPQYGAAGGTAGTGIGAVAGLVVILAIYKLNSKFIHTRLRKSHIPRQERYVDIAFAVLKTAWPIILGSALFSISGVIDSMMITHRLNASGMFSLTETAILLGQFTGKYIVLTTLPVVISTAMATASIPSIAASNTLKDEKAVTSKINLALRMAMILTIPAAVGLSVLGDPIVRLLFPTHPDGGHLLQWGGVAVIFIALYQIATGILQGLGYVKLPVISAFVAVIAKIILNYILIANPRFNIIGAVISTTVCYIVASTLNTIMLKRVTHAKIDFTGVLVKPIICAIGMGVVSYGVYEAAFYVSESNAISVFTAITFGAAVYFLGMLLIKGIVHSDLRGLPKSDKLIRALNRLGL